MTDFTEAAREWIRNDPDPDTRAELLAILDRNDTGELRERFAARLEFGTAGIRGTLGAGPGRMNRALVRQVTAGLARYLLDEVPDCRTQGVVVGRDSRRMSPEFAHDIAAVLTAAGITVHAFPDPVPTPVCGFAVTELGAAAGIVVTASHNPPADNGYKVFWSDGAQIIPPHDTGISERIDAVGPAGTVTLISEGEAKAKGLWREIDEGIQETYIRGVLSHRRHPDLEPGDLTIVYTPLHGVGGKWVREVLARSGYGRVFVVPQQAAPDPDFSTVSSPNPENPEALTLARELAGQKNADLVLANDPDADRLAVLIRDPAIPGSAYRALTGNEIGILLAHYLLTEGAPGDHPLVITTIVSTRLLVKMAGDLGAHYAETLTGFKWIAAKAQELKTASGYRFVTGFEEALGYTVGDLVRDKDGIGAALALADLCALLKSRGQTLPGHLETIYRRWGFHLTRQESLVLSGSEGRNRIAEILSSLRTRSPETIAGSPVMARSDYETGIRLDLSSGEETVLDLPSSNVLVFEMKDSSRFVIRPSGTEPKLKIYLEVVEDLDERKPAALGYERAVHRLNRLGDEVAKLVIDYT